MWETQQSPDRMQQESFLDIHSPQTVKTKDNGETEPKSG